MAITPDQYHLLIAAPMLQDYFVDKDTAEALSGGFVYFFHDTDRQRLKNVYTQTGTPGNYSYVPIANPVRLTSVGTMADSYGNDIIPFFFPYDEEDSNEIDTYYVAVYASLPDGSQASIPEFTRENFPLVSTSNNPDDDQLALINLIPNGQFTAHNNLPNSGVFPNGEEVVTVAQGGSAGWYFTKPDTSSDTDVIVFDQLLQEPPNVTGNPRFAIDITCQGTSGNDTFKELRVRFNNVNRFASDTNIYTFSFTGKSNSASTLNVIFKTIRNFGTGGSATLETDLQEFTLLSGMYDIFSFSFVFGTNEAYTIGTENDDYIELAISFPPNNTFSASLTDFILVAGTVDITNYPERPDNMVFADGIAGSMPTPDPDGFDIGLPLILTQAGVDFDNSVVGNIVASPAASLANHLLCDGSTYSTLGYSSTGIPYQRLQQFLLDNGPGGIPLYGTGATYAAGYFATSTVIRLTTNQAGAQTGAADGAVPHATGFTFGNIHTGQASDVIGYTSGVDSLAVIGNFTGNVTNAAAATSGFNVALLNTGAVTIPQYASFHLRTIAASGIVAGSYFTFHANPGNAAYYVWFTIDGVGVDPAPGGTGYQVNLLSTDTAAEVANCIQEAISGYQVSRITCAAASTLQAGDYWTFDANGDTYAVLYVINGVGNNPAGVDVVLTVSLTGSETAEQVTDATILAINNRFFAVPDFRGRFLIGKRGSGQWDTAVTGVAGLGGRYSAVTGYSGNNVATFQNAVIYANDPAATAFQRGTELNNTSINWFIRY